MEPWRTVLRDGILPALPRLGVEALLRALEEDDPRLLRLAEVEPPALPATGDWPCVAADPVALACWHGLGLVTALEVSDAWRDVMYECTLRLKTPAASAPWLDWWDTREDHAARNRELAAEVRAWLGATASVSFRGREASCAPLQPLSRTPA
jgi:hypothetical protein